MDISRYFVYDHWLSIVMDRSVYKLLPDDEFIQNVNYSLLREYCLQLSSVSQFNHLFIYTKVPVAPNSQRLIQCIVKADFHLIDTNVQFRKTIGSSTDNIYTNNCRIRFAQQKDLEAITELARNNFVYSRFHIDNEISKLIANKIKAEWVSNFFLGKRGDSLLVASVDNKIVGFTLLLHSTKILVIDLIAIDKSHHRQGLASFMLAHAEHCFSDLSFLQVGTQLVNVPSIRLYEKMGFRFLESNYVFHFHDSSGVYQ